MRKLYLLFIALLLLTITTYSQVIESFESAFPPFGWSLNHTSGTTDWGQSSTAPHTGTYNANSSNPAAGGAKNIILNLSVNSTASTLTYWVAVSSIQSTTAILSIYAGTSLSSLILLRTIDLEDASIFTANNTYVQFTDYIDGTTNQSSLTIDLRGESSSFIQWSHSKNSGTAASCRLDDVVINDATPVPVELTSFTATAMKNEVMLNWSTATEVNNYGFEIQRQTNLRGLSNLEGFTTISFIEGHGNSNSPNDYSFMDNSSVTGEVSYRLKQIDTDGTFEYSDVVKVKSSRLAKYELYQNHPNPFNPSTVVSFSLPEMAHVKLTVYNAIGQEVAKLVDKEMEAGYHNVTFDGSSLATGLYIYRLETPNYSKTMKMMMIK